MPPIWSQLSYYCPLDQGFKTDNLTSGRATMCVCCSVQESHEPCSMLLYARSRTGWYSSSGRRFQDLLREFTSLYQFYHLGICLSKTPSEAHLTLT